MGGLGLLGRGRAHVAMATGAGGGPNGHQGRWPGRRAAALALRALARALPPLAAAAAAAAMVRWGRRPDGAAQGVAWVVAVLSLTAATMVVVGRLGRRLLPLSALLGVALAFPGPPPRRVRLGLGIGRPGDLDDRLAAFRRHGLSADPGRAATQAVALLAALAARHWGIWAHAERAARLADRVGADLGLGPDERDRLRWGALLHDLGALALDPTLPVQVRPLEGTDIRAVHEHPAAGSRLLAPLREWLGEWAAAVDQHHERWEGGGYPLGLAGEEIARGARIVAVADAFDAMTAPSSYRSPTSSARARAEIGREAGRQFDPAVVEAFLRRRWRRPAAVPVPYGWRADTPVWGRLRRPAGLVAGSAALVAAALAAGLSVDGEPAPAPQVAGRTVERPAGEGRPAPTTAAAVSTTAPGPAPALSTIPAQITADYAGEVMRALDRALGDALRELVAAGGPTPAFEARLASIYEEPELSRKRGVYASEGARSIDLLRPDPPDPVTTVERVVRGEPGCVVLAVRRDFSQLLTRPAEPPPPSFVVLRPRPPAAERGPRNPTPWSMAFDGVTADGRPPSAVC